MSKAIGIGISPGFQYYRGQSTPPTLESTILEIGGNNLLTYWPLYELGGTTADNLEGTSDRDGTYSGVALGQEQSPFITPYFDGVWDGGNYVQMYSSSLNNVFNGLIGTMFTFVKVYNSGVWTDGSSRPIMKVQNTSGDYIRISKGADYTLNFYYRADGITEIINKTSVSETGWMYLAVTWDKTGSGDFTAYYNAVQEGTPQAIAGTWEGDLFAGSTIIGASSTVMGDTFHGYISNAGILDKVLSIQDLLNIYSISGV